jgi:ribosome-associated protein
VPTRKQADTKKPSVHSPEAAALLALIQTSLDDDKGEEIVTIDLKGKTSFADYMVVGNGRSNRQVAAMADHLLHKLKDAGYGNCHVEGLSQGDWVLIDAGDVIVHLFRPEVRNFYNLEKMWTVDLAGENPLN